jgi:hypothetical protein
MLTAWWRVNAGQKPRRTSRLAKLKGVATRDPLIAERYPLNCVVTELG